jgi:hypothetical protein
MLKTPCEKEEGAIVDCVSCAEYQAIRTGRRVSWISGRESRHGCFKVAGLIQSDWRKGVQVWMIACVYVVDNILEPSAGNQIATRAWRGHWCIGRDGVWPQIHRP